MAIARTSAAGVAAATVLLGLGVWTTGAVVGGDQADAGAATGTVTPVEYVFDLQHEYRVALPVGTLDLDVSPPSSHVQVEPVDNDLGQDVDAGWRHRVITVDWVLVDRPLLTSSGRSPDAVITLVDGERRTEMGSVSTVAGTESDQTGAYTIVDGDGSGLRLEVAFDGVAQSIDLDTGVVDEGAAAVLDTAGAWYGPDRSCAVVRTHQGSAPARFGCAVGPLQYVGWLPDQGWAAPGTSWAVATLTTGEASIDVGRGGATYQPEGERVDARLDGAAPVGADRRDTSPSGDYRTATTTLVWSVTGPPHEVTVDRTVTFSGHAVGHRQAPAPLTVHLHSTLPLHEV